MSMSPLSPLILTIKIDSESFVFFDALRRKYFPPERNHLSAHITLFHHLPGTNYEEIEAFLKLIAARQSSFELIFSAVKFIGRGSIVQIDSPDLILLRNKLARSWSDWLTPQDRQKFMPHITVQNKVDPIEARAVYEQLTSTWQVRTGRATGIQLWHYKNGPWHLGGEYKFSFNSETDANNS